MVRFWIGAVGLAMGIGAAPAQARDAGDRYEYVYLQQVRVTAKGIPAYQVASVVLPEAGPCEEAQMVNRLRYPVVIYGKTYWIDEPHVGIRPIPGCGRPVEGGSCE